MDSQAGQFGVSHWRNAFLVVVALLCVSFAQPARAAVAVAGTVIQNIATVSYGIGGVPQSPVISSAATFRVDEIINPVLIWQDGASVSVNSPSADNVLTFVLTNGGNGQERFSLARTNGPAPLLPANFTPANGTTGGASGALFLESGALAGFQAIGPNADLLYVAGVNDPDLPPNGGQTIYVLSDVPAGLTMSAVGQVLLQVGSLTAGAAGQLPGTSLAGLGQGGGFAVVGSGRAQASSIGSYMNNGLVLGISKSVVAVVDQNGNAVPKVGGIYPLMPSYVMTYELVAKLVGAGTANNLVIVDPLPAEVVYVPNSIMVDGIAKTDVVDADNAQFDTVSNKVSVSLGNVASPANIVVTFRATIK